MKNSKILVLLATTLISIVGLQVYATFKRYQQEIKDFEQKANFALQQAIEQVHSERKTSVVENLKKSILNDSIAYFDLNWNVSHQTYFIHIQDKNTLKPGQHEVTFSKTQFSTLQPEITPEFKEVVINEWLKDIHKELDKGVVWYYTQNIGDYLNEQYFEKPISQASVIQKFNILLKKQGIFSPFSLAPIAGHNLATQIMPYSIKNEEAKIKIYFQKPYTYLIRQQVISLLGSLLLITLAALSFALIYRQLNTHEKLKHQKDQLITHITHELKTPITAIQSSAEALDTYDWPIEQRKIFIQIIRQQSHNLNNLCSEILEQVLLNKNNIVRETVPLHSLIEGFKIHFPDLQIHNQIPPQLDFKSDVLYLSKICNNLFDNARKYNTSVPKICVVHAIIIQNHLELTFSDNGMGIDKSYHDLIFERFYRIMENNNYNQKGYGIGLSMVKEAVKALGGKVSLQSELKNGSTFILRFPI